ncbi:autotransporter assembly complex protein TamA [Neogemmobacter tilapiae]|uniref:Outer membrane protein assembly factor n=1 Tax=Neogemmobacter tilapiae TaxID=875041 RepID=A0A918TJD7_9RHOB|nr:autotransporter assembly complex family protein [Gemmobacter tilapiae]GHC50410.1 outer membrane protein assembly factor [Gemmobacter tilapiae]
MARYLVTLSATALTAALLSAALPTQAQDLVDFRVSSTDEDLTETLKDSSALLEAAREKTQEPGDLFAAALSEYGRMVGALYAQGHYSPVVHVLVDGREAASIPALDAPAQIRQVIVTVDPGPTFLFSRAAIGPLATGTELPEGFATGQVAQSDLVVESVTAATKAWRDLGHAKAGVAAQKIVANHPAQTLAADIAMDPGPRLRFGPLSVEGIQRMKERRVRKIAGLPEGEVFSPEELDRAADRLRRTGVFSSVSMIESETIQSPDLLPITAMLVEQKPRHYSLGAELSSLEGAKLTGEWTHRNLLGGAERLTFSGEILNIGAATGGTDYGLEVTLDRPATFTPDTTLGLKFGIGRLNEEDFTADLAVAGVSLSHYFSPKLSGSLGIEYEYGKFDISGTEITLKHLALPIGLTWDSRDEPLDATKGFYVDGEIKPFKGFGVTASGLRAVVDARAYRGFGEDARFVVAGRVQAGAIFGADPLTTPQDDLFYTGGGGSVRGQPYQSLGATDASGAALGMGGTEFMAGSLELRAKITQKIGLVGFVDAGQVSMDGGGSDWHAGAGLGARYDTGFGPIRLDVATPVGGDTGDGVQFYIGIGQAF